MFIIETKLTVKHKGQEMNGGSLLAKGERNCKEVSTKVGRDRKEEKGVFINESIYL
jgi:hypothetical protein